MSSHHEPHRRLPYFAAQSISTAWPDGFRFVVVTQLNRPRPDTKKAVWLSLNVLRRPQNKEQPNGFLYFTLAVLWSPQSNDTAATRPRQAHQSIFSIWPRGWTQTIYAAPWTLRNRGSVKLAPTSQRSAAYALQASSSVSASIVRVSSPGVPISRIW